MPEYFDKNCNLITKYRHNCYYNNPRYCEVLFYSKGEFYISTIWVGMEMGAGPSGPLIFKTNLLDSNGIQVYKYSTQEEAIINHNYLITGIEFDPDFDSNLGQITENNRWQNIARESPSK